MHTSLYSTWCLLVPVKTLGTFLPHETTLHSLAWYGSSTATVTRYAHGACTKMRANLVALFLLVSMVCTIRSARILGIFHMPAYSHHQLGDKILKELAARGHEVTVITPYADKTPVKNVKQVLLTGFIEQIEKVKVDLLHFSDNSILSNIIELDMLGITLTENTLKHPNVQKLIQSNEKFDMVVIEQFLCEAFKGFCHHFNAHCVMLSTVAGSRWSNPQMANPAPPSYVPDIYLNLSPRMNFFERLKNSLVYVLGTLVFHLFTFRKQDKLMHQYFPDTPPLSELYYNNSLMLMNSHVSTNPPVPYLPNMIEIGGYHVNAPKPLPKDIQDYLDSAKDGAILFSLGSNLKSKDLPEDKRRAFLNVFSELKQKILWKWEDDILPGQPANVKLGKWLPQQDILAHPNIQLFITHGGMLSTIEAIYHGKPILGIPMFGDQDMNVANAEISGFAVGLPYKKLTEESLRAALTEVLNNPKYAENAQRRSKVMHDQPTKPLDRAIFWLEYVLRHGGAPHLKSAALRLKWYQYLMLDVVLFIAAVFFILIFIVYKVLKLVLHKNEAKRVSQSKKKS